MEIINSYGRRKKIEHSELINGTYIYVSSGQNQSEHWITVTLGLGAPTNETPSPNGWQIVEIRPSDTEHTGVLEVVMIAPGESFCSILVFESFSKVGWSYLIKSSETGYSKKTRKWKLPMELYMDLKNGDYYKYQVFNFNHENLGNHYFPYIILAGSNCEAIPEKMQIKNSKRAITPSLKRICIWKLGKAIKSENMSTLELPKKLIKTIEQTKGHLEKIQEQVYQDNRIK